MIKLVKLDETVGGGWNVAVKGKKMRIETFDDIEKASEYLESLGVKSDTIDDALCWIYGNGYEEVAFDDKGSLLVNS